LNANFTGFTTGSLANVETVALSTDGSIARTFTGTKATGVEEYQLTGAINLAGQTEIATVTAGARTADLSITYATDVTKGTADSLSLGITDFGTADDAATTANEEKNVDVTVAGIETLAITASGTNVVDLTNAASKTVTVEGAGSVKVIDVNAATKSIDASGLTGDATIAMATAAAATSVSTGSGDDSLTLIADSDVAANATLAGGEGDDALTLTSGTGAATVQFVQSGFETVNVGDLAGALTVSMKNTTGVTSVVALGEAATAGDMDENLTLAGAGADLAYDLQGVNGSNAVLTSDATGAATITVSTPAKTATATSPSVNTVDVTASGATSASLTVDSAMDYQGTVTAAKATTVEIAVNGEMNGAVAAAAATSVNITAVAQASVIDLDAAKATDLVVANAKDLAFTGSTLTGVESFTSSGAGAITTTDMSALNVATVTNTGAVDLGVAGSATLDYGVTLTSTGAKSFTLGDATDAINTQNQAITLSVTGATGAIDIDGDIEAGTGAVDLTFGTTSTVALDAIVGKNVSLDASAALVR